MSDSKMNPLPNDIEDLLKSAKRPEVPAAFNPAVLSRIKGTLAVPASGLGDTSASPSAAAVSKLGSWGLPLSLAALVAGVGSGIVIGRSTAPAPIVTGVQAPAAPRLPPPPPHSVQPTEPETKKPDAPTRQREAVKPPVDSPPPTRDVALADERALIEIARTALAKRQTAKALEALQSHADKFATGQLVEERESLWVQALVNAGERAQAKTKADAFRRRFPESMLLPAVDAALAAP